jgi:putative aldouronate transport system substrate-binding protein
MMKKAAAVLLVLALMGGILYAGGTQGGSRSSGGLTEISALVWDRGTTPASQGTLDSNWWTRYVDEQTEPLGVKMKWVVIPRAQETQMLSTMLAANNAPDISKAGDIPLLKTYISGGGVTDITPYINRFGENIVKLYGDEIFEDIKLDGKIYYLPHLQNDLSPRTTWIRKDWLDAIGMNIPGTPDEFYLVLKTIKEKDPGKIGSALIPLGMVRQTYSLWDRVVLPGFVKDVPSPERFLVPFPMWPEAKEALRWLNKLNAEGLLTDEFILDKDDSLFKQKIARGEMFAFINSGHYPYHSAYGELYDKLKETAPNAVLANISTFRYAKDGPRIEYYPSKPTYEYRWFVPISSKNPELAVRILNWMSSGAGYLIGGLGVEEQDYKIVNDVPTIIDRDTYLARVPWIEPQYGLMSKPYASPAEKDIFLLNYIKDFNPRYFDQIKSESNLLSDEKYYPPTISLPTPVSDKLSPVVANFWGEEISKIITAPPANFDRIFDDALREYRSLGGDEIVAETQRVYR